MCPLGYHDNDFVATHTLGRMLYGYTLLVPMSQRVLNKPSKEHNGSGYKWLTTHRVLESLVHWYRQCVTVSHAPKYMSCYKAIVVITEKAHCFHDYIYIMLILFPWDLNALDAFNARCSQSVNQLFSSMLLKSRGKHLHKDHQKNYEKI